MDCLGGMTGAGWPGSAGAGRRIRDGMIKQTESYSIEFDFIKNRFTTTCLTSGQKDVQKRANVILIQKAWKELDALSDFEINQMCDATFGRNLKGSGGNDDPNLTGANWLAFVWLSVIIIIMTGAAIGAWMVWFVD